MKLVLEIDLDEFKPASAARIGAIIAEFGNNLRQFHAPITDVTHPDGLVAELISDSRGLVYARAQLSNMPFEHEPEHEDYKHTSIPSEIPPHGTEH